MMRLIYFSPVHARSYAQRPHYTVEAWLRLGAERVLWIDPYPCRLPRWQDLAKLGQRGPRRGLNDQGTQLDPRIEVLSAAALPIEPLPGGAWLNRHLLWPAVRRRMSDFAGGGSLTLGVGRPSALALAALDWLRPTAVFYEAMDNFPEFHSGLSRRSVRWYEDRLAARADLVVASSTFLSEKFERRGCRVTKALNGYAMSTLPPYETAARPAGPVVLGFIGCLGRWIDWTMINRLARELPEVQIEMIGPQAVPSPVRLPTNIRLLPPCSQPEAAAHLARFSAGLIPFLRTPLTDGMDPIKFYEYRAMGLPVLSTAFGEMVRRGPGDGVYFLDRGEGLRSVVERALAHRVDAAEVAAFRHENDWQRRFRECDSFRPIL